MTKALARLSGDFAHRSNVLVAVSIWHPESSYQDSGIGIAPDQLAGIFDEFCRVEKDPASRNGSLGPGLSIVERSANLLGTKVEVESELGQGSSFSLVVPTGSTTGVRSTEPAR